MWPSLLINAFPALAGAQGSYCLIQTGGNDYNNKENESNNVTVNQQEDVIKRLCFINSCRENLSMFLVKSVRFHFLGL